MLKHSTEVALYIQSKLNNETLFTGSTATVVRFISILFPPKKLPLSAKRTKTIVISKYHFVLTTFLATQLHCNKTFTKVVYEILKAVTSPIIIVFTYHHMAKTPDSANHTILITYNT